MEPEEILILTSVIVSIYTIIIVGVFFILFKRKALQNRQELEFLQYLQKKIVDTQEAEREELSNNLHDDLGPQLSLISCQMWDLRLQILESNNIANIQKLEDVSENIKRLLEDFKHYSNLLFPNQLKYLGLSGALEALFQNVNKDVFSSFHCDVELDELPFDTSLSIFRICAEVLNNIVKHSQPGQIDFITEIQDKHLILEFNHDGIPYEQEEFLINAKAQIGKGSASILNRVKMLGGEIYFGSMPMNLVQVKIKIPIQNDGN